MIADPRAGADDIVDFLLGFLATTSLATQERAAADYMAAAMTHHGFTVSRDSWGNVCAERVFGPGPTLLIDTHLDTVDVSDRASWTTDPAGEVRDGRVYGRGAVDMKGPAAAVLFGAAAIENLQVGRLVISATVAEELVEGPALMMVCERFAPDAVIIAEPSGLKLIHAQRGRAEIVIEVTGRAAHSAYPQSGVNAVEAMAEVIAALRASELPSDPVLGHAALVVTDIVSSPYPGQSVLPVTCRATFDRRLIDGEQRDGVIAEILRIASAAVAPSGATVTVTVATDDLISYTGERIVAENFAPAWVTSRDSSLFGAALTGVQSVLPGPTIATYRFCTNGSGSAGALGIPTLGFGPGAEDEAHTADESISIEHLHTGAAVFAALIPAVLTGLQTDLGSAFPLHDDPKGATP